MPKLTIEIEETGEIKEIDTNEISTIVGRGIWGKDYINNLAKENSIYGASEGIDSEGNKVYYLASWQKSKKTS